MVVTAYIQKSFTYAKQESNMRGESKFIFSSVVIADANHSFSLMVGQTFLVNGYNETSCLITYDGIMYSVFYSWQEGKVRVERKGQI